MRYRVTHSTYTLITAGTRRRPGDEWECDADTLPEWDALHSALARGLVSAVRDSAPVAAPVVDDTAGAEPGESDGLDEMTRAELWRMYDGDALTYRTATREALIAALRGD
jgi:hypothetical protein